MKLHDITTPNVNRIVESIEQGAYNDTQLDEIFGAIKNAAAGIKQSMDVRKKAMIMARAAQLLEPIAYQDKELGNIVKFLHQQSEFAKGNSSNDNQRYQPNEINMQRR